MKKIHALVAVVVFGAMCANAQSENKSEYVTTQNQISFEDKEAYLERRGNLEFTDLQVYNLDGLKAHHVTLGVNLGGLFTSDGFKPGAKLTAGYETRHFHFEGFIGGALNEIPNSANVDAGKGYFGLQAGGQVSVKLMADVNHKKWAGVFLRYNGAWYRTDGSSADYVSTGSGSEFAAGLVGNVPVSDQMSVRLLAGVGNKIKVEHNTTQWDNFRLSALLEASLVYHFNK